MSGGFAAADAFTGKYLWHFETNHAIVASPMTYAIVGKQFIVIDLGANVCSSALPKWYLGDQNEPNDIAT